MFTKRLSVLPVVLILAALVACNLPGGQNQSQDAALTAAVQTFAAQLTGTAAAQGTSTPSLTPKVNQPTATATSTPPPSSTPKPATATPVPCNLAGFVSDVSIPDGTQVLVGQAFTKTWRFQNIGTCTWTSTYQLVFDQGDQMGGPVSQPLTSGTVPSGSTVDVSVNLTAPATSGTYRGYWRFRDPGSVLFGLNTGSFWVEIKAVSPTPTPTITLTSTSTTTPGLTLTPTSTATITVTPTP